VMIASVTMPMRPTLLNFLPPFLPAFLSPLFRPKWVASIVFLGFLALAITIAVSVIMGWNMVAPRVQMVRREEEARA